MAWMIVAQLDDELRQVRFYRLDAAVSEVLVEANFLCGHGLDLDDLIHLVARRDVVGNGVRFVRVSCPVHDAPVGGDVGL